MEMIKVVKVFHIASLALWLGSLFVILVLLSFWKRWGFDGRAVHEIVKKLSRTVDLPLMIIAVLTGITMLFLQAQPAFKAGWFHLKMTAAIVLIGLDCITRRCIKKELPGKIALWGLLVFIALLLMTLSSIYIIKK